MDEDQTRSSSAQALAPDVPAEGVGGRQADPPPPPGGGGYQDIRSILNFRAGDMRIDDLKKMGLPSRHLRVAECIGVDAYLRLWALVGTDADFLNRHGYIELKMRPFRSFLRFQRNRHIQALAAAGAGAEEIRQRVQVELCELLSRRHILRVMAKK